MNLMHSAPSSFQQRAECGADDPPRGALTVNPACADREFRTVAVAVEVGERVQRTGLSAWPTPWRIFLVRLRK